MPSPLLVNVADLLRRPGTERDLVCDVSTPELSLDDERFGVDDRAHVALHLESLTDGIVVTGELRVPYAGTCRRCLRPVNEVATSAVQELYQVIITDNDAFAINGEQLDLRAMVRESLLLDTPHDPLCRPDCAGLCPYCGVDRNDVSCDCQAPSHASPWDVLDQLRPGDSEN